MLIKNVMKKFKPSEFPVHVRRTFSALEAPRQWMRCGRLVPRGDSQFPFWTLMLSLSSHQWLLMLRRLLGQRASVDHMTNVTLAGCWMTNLFRWTWDSVTSNRDKNHVLLSSDATTFSNFFHFYLFSLLDRYRVEIGKCSVKYGRCRFSGASILQTEKQKTTCGLHHEKTQQISMEKSKSQINNYIYFRN